MDENSYITLKGSFKKCLIGYDHKSTNLDSKELSDEISVKLSSKKISLLQYKDINYVYRLRKAFVAD